MILSEERNDLFGDMIRRKLIFLQKAFILKSNLAITITVTLPLRYAAKLPF